MASHTRILRREYTGNLSLKITDHCIKASLLEKYSPKVPEVIPKSPILDNGQFLLELGNVLSSRECAEIMQNADKCIFEDVSDKYRFGKQRNSSRLLALDEMLTDNLWNSINTILLNEMEKHGVATRPLGFDVTRGVWELHGLNEAVRINKYSGETKGHFGPHKDAQFCPNGDKRSILTLLVYLNEDFKGGETCFYFPKNATQATKGMTIKEEIDSHGGLNEGFKQVKIVPKVGHAVLGSHSILHEALSVQKGIKYILKTDVVVKRHSKEFGFAVEEREKKDYLMCLNYFREAQQQELEKNFDIASDLYEKALSIRYCHPISLTETQSAIDTSGYQRLPTEVWLHVFKFLSGFDAQHLVYAYPELNVIKGIWEQQQRNAAPILCNEKYFPIIRYQKGVMTSFEFKDANFFQENVTACCRVAAMYSFFLLGHSMQDDYYTVRYNPETQEVCVVALETLLTDVFYNHRCYGSFYNIQQQDAEKRDPKKDFETSMDRNYMLMKHGVEFTGVELPDSFYAKSVVKKTLCYKLSDDDDDLQDDDNEKARKTEVVYDGNDKYCYHDKDYYDNILTFYDDDDDDIDDGDEISVESAMRFLLLAESQSRALYYIPKSEIFVDVIGRNCKDSVSKYFDDIGSGKVSAALVSKLNKPLQFQQYDVCVCLMEMDEEVTSNVAESCSTEHFNHLVFDFQESQLSVKFSDAELEAVHEIFEANSSQDVVLREIKELECTGKLLTCEVSIEPVLSPDTSFNHASCQCGVPRFDVLEYYNLKQYPHLTSVSVYAKEKSGKMIVWTVYNGIVAL